MQKQSGFFKDTITQKEIIEPLFNQFTAQLESQGIITHTGTIVDATFVDAPRQRNTREENNQIKNGEIPKEWEKNTHKLAQKDTDARWTKKNDETHYGYKNHVKWMPTVRLLRITQPHQQIYMTAMNFQNFSEKLTR